MPDDSVIDEQIVRQILDMQAEDDDGEAENGNLQFQAFYDQAKEIISQLEEAQRSRDVDTIRRLGETLRPSSEGVGATQMTQRLIAIGGLFDPQNGRAINNDSITCASKAKGLIAVLELDLNQTKRTVEWFTKKYKEEKRGN